MKNILLITITVLFSLTTMAQKPAWADYYKRQNMYPDKDYLVGFVSGINSEEKDAGDLKSIYETMAKDKLIQGIQVEIESNNKMNISNTNGQSTEEFLSKSVSFSKANVSGLNTQSFYDRKKKEVFAIAFVNKKELAYFYFNSISSGIENIEQKLAEGKKYAKKGKKEDALRSFYECMPVFQKMDEARVLLIALNRKMYADVNNDEINRLKDELIEDIDSLLKPNELTLSESAYFVAYGLFLQLGDLEQAIFVDNFTFENTGLESSFSEKWNKEFSAALVKSGSYKIAEKNSYGNVTAYGNYWTEGNLIKISVSVLQEGKVVAVSKGSLPISWLEKENVDFIPVQVKKMQALAEAKLEVIKYPESIKLGSASTEEIKTELRKNGQALGGIPIAINNLEKGLKLCSSKTNDFGYSICYLPSISSQNKILRLEASIDLQEYLRIEKESVYYAIATAQNPVVAVPLDIEAKKPTIFVRSEEKIQYYNVDIKTLEPAIKEMLSEKSYNFVDEEAEADFIVKIKANTTTGTYYHGIYFAYLDANVSIIDNSTGEEIYKTHLDQLKGGGANYKKAAKKAYALGAVKLKEMLNSSFFDE